MKIQINEYNTEAFEFAKVYLKYYEPEWFGTPGHMLVSPEFWKTLNDGVLDSDEFNVVFNPVRFDAEECLIIQRYYFTHLAKYKKDKQNIIDNTNLGRVFMELGPNGSIFQNRKNKKKSTGGRRYRRTHRRSQRRRA